MNDRKEETMMNKPTDEQAKKLLNAIFDKTDTDETDDNYLETVVEKVGYAQYVITHNLQNIGRIIHRLSRLYNLLTVSEKGKSKLPDIITNNELRMALEPLLQVENDVKDIAEMLMEIYRETKPKKEVTNEP